MRRFIPWTDIAVYGGLALVAVAGAIFAALTPQEWPVGKVFAVMAVPLAFVVLAIIVIGGKWQARPDYISRTSAAIWTVLGSPGMSDMDKALWHFINEIVLHADVSYDQAGDMISTASIEWRKGKVGAIGFGWHVKGKAGLQQGKHILLEWPGSIKESVLFHELGHMVQELVLKRPAPDYWHEDVDFWEIISEIERSYEP